MFGKVITAMITPFSKGKVNYKEAQRILKFLEKNGTDAILLCGSTGENPTMTKDEKLKLIEKIKEIASVPIIVGTGSFNTKETVEFTKEVDRMNIDGFLLVTPYYNKPNQIGIFEHFKKIANCTEKPIMLYNIPGRCVKEIEVETIIKLSKIKNIISLKAACGNLVKISQTKNNILKDKFFIYSGDDFLTLPILSIGGCGVVSVASHIIGNQINKMVTDFLSKNTLSSKKIHLKYLDIFINLFCDTNPVPVKYALYKMGFNTKEVRLPLVELSNKNKKNINNLLLKYNII